MTRRGDPVSVDIVEKQTAKALRNGIAEVARKYSRASEASIRQGLIWAMERRGFYDFKPDEEAIQRVRVHGQAPGS